MAGPWDWGLQAHHCLDHSALESPLILVVSVRSIEHLDIIIIIIEHYVITIIIIAVMSQSQSRDHSMYSWWPFCQWEFETRVCSEWSAEGRETQCRQLVLTDSYSQNGEDMNKGSLDSGYTTGHTTGHTTGYTTSWVQLATPLSQAVSFGIISYH